MRLRCRRFWRNHDEENHKKRIANMKIVNLTKPRVDDSGFYMLRLIKIAQ